MFERPLLLLLLVAAPLAAAAGLTAARGGKLWAGTTSAALRVGALVALVFVLAGFGMRARIPATRVEVVALVDDSLSIAPDQRDWMRTRVRALARHMGSRDRLGVLSFGRDVRMRAPLGDPRIADLPGETADGHATDIASALTVAAGLFSTDSEKRVLLLTDGNETAGDVMLEAPAIAQDSIRVFADTPPASSDSRVALVTFSAPETVRVGQRFAIALEMESEALRPAQVSVQLFDDGKPVGGQTVTLRSGLNRFNLPYRIANPGAHVVTAKISASPLVSVNPDAERAITASPAPKVLVVGASPPETLMAALRLRDYTVDIASPRGLPENPEAYLPYQAIFLADVSSANLSASAGSALGRYVSDLGGGLIVLGETLRDEHFASTPIEKALPIRFVPQPPPPSREPIAVYLCIDRSNSMSYDSRYPAVRDGERIRYAKAAATALLRQLDDTDLAGVIAFDSQPYVLGHLAPLGEDREELENRISRLEPGGGTDFKDALEIAQREILASGLPVRQIFLLTDGDTNRQYHDHDALIADFARQHIPVSTIRIGPDLANLQLLQDFAQATGGTFYRVQDIEKLPLLLVGLTREAMNRRKQGRTTIEANSPSSMLSGIDLQHLPPIDYYATTAVKEGAQAPLQIRHGDSMVPLLAAWQYGLGRSAIFAADPDSLATLSWIRWDHYAEFWSQVVSWAMRQGDAGAFTIRIRDSGDGGIRFEAEKADSAPIANLALRIIGPGRTVDVAMSEIDATLYRGEIAPLARGRYNAALLTKAGDTEKILAQREFASTGQTAADAEELKIRPPNLAMLARLAETTGGALHASDAEIVRSQGATITTRLSADSWLLPLATILFIAEIFVRRRFLGD